MLPERIQRCAKAVERDYSRKPVIPTRVIQHSKSQAKVETHPDFFKDIFAHLKELKEAPDFFDMNQLYECYVNLAQAEFWYMKATKIQE